MIQCSLSDRKRKNFSIIFNGINNTKYLTLRLDWLNSLWDCFQHFFLSVLKLCFLFPPRSLYVYGYSCPSIHLLEGRFWSLSQHLWVRAGSPWTSCQFITGLTYGDKVSFTLTFTPTHNLQCFNQLTKPPVCMFLVCGRRPEYSVRTQADTGRTCKLHTEMPWHGNWTQDLLAVRQQC